MSQQTARSIPDLTARATSPPWPARAGRPDAAFALALFALAAGLAVNTALGPLGTEVIRYPITGTLLNQTLGLEIVTVALVAPLAVVAGLLTLRGHRAAPLLGFGPAAYAAYMFVQYVLGPEYAAYTHTVLFHTAIFTLAAALTGWAWVRAAQEPMPQLTDRRRRICGALLLLLAGFIISRYLGVVAEGVLPAEFDQARTFFWSIFLLDLGVVVPATLLAGVALLHDARPAHTALYALMGWYALVPPSVAAMSATMVINDDPHAVTGQVTMFGIVAVVATVGAVWVFTPLLKKAPHPARSTQSLD